MDKVVYFQQQVTQKPLMKAVHTSKKIKSCSLDKLVSMKKVEISSYEKDKEILLNDFDLDANEIFSWFRGTTDFLTLNSRKNSPTTKPEVKSH